MPKPVTTQSTGGGDNIPEMNCPKRFQYESSSRESGCRKEEESKFSGEKQNEKEEFGSVMTAASALTTLVSQPSRAVNASSKSESTLEKSTSDTTAVAVVPKGRPKAIPFPQKLMQVLANEEYSEIIAWLHHGEAFVIFSPKKLVAEVLPKNFKQAKYSSFTRKLHRWGFQRKLRGAETGAFYHDLFKRERQDLCLSMSCHQPKPDETPQDTRIAATPHSEPLTTRRWDSAQPLTLSSPLINQPEQTATPAHTFPESSIASDIAGTLDLLNHARLETFRRLRERADAANRSRQALSILQQYSQSLPPINPINHPSILSHLSHRSPIINPLHQALRTSSLLRPIHSRNDLSSSLTTTPHQQQQRLESQHERNLIDLSLRLAMSRSQATTPGLALTSNALSPSRSATDRFFVPNEPFPSNANLVSDTLRTMERQELMALSTAASRQHQSREEEKNQAETRLVKNLARSLRDLDKKSNVPKAA